MRSREEIQVEIGNLQRLLKKRTGRAGFSANVDALNARLAECQAELGNE